MKEQGINTVLTFLPSSQNSAAYEAAGFRVFSHPVEGFPDEGEEVEAIFAAMDTSLAPAGASVLIHRDTIDDAMSGILAGYLVHSGLVEDPIIATSVIQEIVGRPLGPKGRSLIPVGD